MKFFTIDQARFQAKSEAEDDANLTFHANAAESACARLCNRSLFVDAAERDEAIATIPSRMSAAFSAYDTAMENAATLTDTRERLVAESIARKQMEDVKLECDNDLYGKIADSDIIEAIMLTMTHFYTFREVGEVPAGAQRLLAIHMKIGPY